MQGYDGIAGIILDTLKAFATGVPIAGALYFAWKKHTIETAKATASIIEAAIERSEENLLLSQRLSVVETTLGTSEVKLDKINTRVDEIFSLLLKRQNV